MNEAVHGCPADLVFNLDEVGISDWEFCDVMTRGTGNPLSNAFD
jgi:hypothetical protein